MSWYEEEFECSDCGAPVREGAGSCPKCGVLFETPSEKPDAVEELQCSECGASVREDAVACPKCGVRFESAPDNLKDAHAWTCSNCGLQVSETEGICPGCGTEVGKHPTEEEEYVCSQCSAKVRRRDKMCTHCGATLYTKYFSVAPHKLALLSFCTGGIYLFYWYYRNWSLIKEQDRSAIRPIWRSLFWFVYCFPLFERILVSARVVGYAKTYSPYQRGAALIALQLMGRLPAPLFLISLLGFWPLLAIQKAVNFNNTTIDPSQPPNTDFSLGEILLVVVCGFIILLGVIATLSGD